MDTQKVTLDLTALYKVNTRGGIMGKVLTRNEIDQILKSTQRKKEPSITLNDVLTSDELNQFRDSIHQYAKEEGIKFDEVSVNDTIKVYHLSGF